MSKGVVFDRETIDVGYYTDLWGPYTFDFPICTSLTANDGLIPYGDTIDSATVKAYLGSADRTTDLTGLTDITTSLIDPDYTPTVYGTHSVQVKFQYPGSTYNGMYATLVFEITTTAGGKREFFFQHVAIKK